MPLSDDETGPVSVPPGALVILNGVSSAGKTSLAEAFRDQRAEAGECWLVWGIDDFLGKLPAPWIAYREEGAHADEGIRFDRRDGDIVFDTGPIGARVLTSYRETMARMVRAGLNVVVDEVAVDDAAWRHWQHLLDGLAARWIRVECPIDVLERRENERGDRLPGLARSQLDTVHRHPAYDLVVDTSIVTPAAGARAIAEELTRPRTG